MSHRIPVLRQNRNGPILRHLERCSSRPRHGILGSRHRRNPAADAPSEAQPHHSHVQERPPLRCPPRSRRPRPREHRAPPTARCVQVSKCAPEDQRLRSTLLDSTPTMVTSVARGAGLCLSRHDRRMAPFRFQGVLATQVQEARTAANLCRHPLCHQADAPRQSPLGRPSYLWRASDARLPDW